MTPDHPNFKQALDCLEALANSYDNGMAVVFPDGYVDENGDPLPPYDVLVNFRDRVYELETALKIANRTIAQLEESNKTLIAALNTMRDELFKGSTK